MEIEINAQVTTASTNNSVPHICPSQNYHRIALYLVVFYLVFAYILQYISCVATQTHFATTDYCI